MWQCVFMSAVPNANFCLNGVLVSYSFQSLYRMAESAYSAKSSLSTGFISSPRYGKVFNLCVSASDCLCTARNVSNSESVCGAMTSPASSLSNISLCLHPLSDEIRKCCLFVLRLGNPCVFSSFPGFQQICHVCAERTHGLQAFLVLSGFFRYKAVDLISVLGRNHMHICHQKILIQPFKGSRCAASAA